MFPTLLKCTFIPGLRSIVLNEIDTYPVLKVIEAGNNEVYLENTASARTQLYTLKTVLNIFVIRQHEKLHPQYIANHKSVLGELIEIVLQSSADKFKTFKLSCAGSNSPEILALETYITEHYKLTQSEEADMEIFIGKDDDVWEIGVRLTVRPLHTRPYRVSNIPGGMNPSIAYAMNSLCNLGSAHSYLNICSGSGTLLIEAGLMNPNLKLVGFDINGKTNALAVDNIKKAGLVKSIHLKTANIFDNPSLGAFDVIVSDLPFGMQVSKGEDLHELYKAFIDYCESTLNPNGTLAVYTAEHQLLEEVLDTSEFKITKTLTLRVPTSIGAYMQTKIFICKLK